MKQIVLDLDNLDCASCAINIEDSIKKLDYVDDISINFATKKAYVNITKPKSEIIDDLINEITNVENVSVSVADTTSTVKKKTPLFVLKRDWHLFVGAALFIIASFNEQSNYYLALILISYIILGKHVLVGSVKNIFKGEIFDENFLMAVATIGALLIKQYPEAVAVMLFYEIGELFQDYAVNQTRNSIESVMDLRVDVVNIKENDRVISIKPSEARVGQIMVVKPGERVALDGIISSGTTQVDTSSLTGEFVPRSINQGDEILSGFINKTNVVEVKITKPESESTVTRILNLVSSASGKKAKVEKFITKFAKVYTPIVVGLALVIGVVPSILNPASMNEWIYKALTFLVVSCPCALVISVPLGLFAGVGSASKNGILIKGGNYLEALADLDCLVFDKTGTLTKGEFKVTKIHPLLVSETELLKIAAIGESFSNHPIAKSIVKAYGQQIDQSQITNYEEIAGHGIKMEYNQHQYLLGNDKFLVQKNLNVPEINMAGSVVFVIEDNQLLGYIIIGDSIKENAQLAIQTLHKLGVKKTVMLTGDRYASAKIIQEQLGINQLQAELLPDQKVSQVETILNQGYKRVGFVGDGMNDAPVLARVDIGISMGGLGSDAAIEASDVVLMEDDPLSIAKAMIIARKTKSILKQNIVFSLLIKIGIMIFVLLGFANMWWGVFGDVGVTVLAILNSMRALKINCQITK